MSDDFTCAHCGETFPKAWSDEEALAEAEVHGFDPDDCVVVCEDCHVKIMAFNDHPLGERR